MGPACLRGEQDNGVGGLQKGNGRGGVLKTHESQEKRGLKKKKKARGENTPLF